MKDKKSILSIVAKIFFLITGLFIVIKTWFSNIQTFWTCIFFAIVGMVGMIFIIQELYYPDLFATIWNSIVNKFYIGG